MKKTFTILTITLTLCYQIASSQDIKKRDSITTNYERNSLYTLMVTNPSRDYEKDITTYFAEKLITDKYNNHNLKKRFIETNYDKDQLDNIVNYINNNKLANQLVAKWYSRSAKGGFNTQLLQERGFYNANSLDIKVAQNSASGLALLKNAGIKLIDNTFILVNDSKYTNKEVVASQAKSIFGALASQYGVSAINTELTNTALTTLGKGFIVSTTSYLFKLVWDEETQARFYNELYATDKEITPEKKAAFDNATFFALDYIGSDKSSADVQSTSFTKKTNGELIGRATIKSIDNVISKLQATYDVFKTKTPVYTTEPLTAKIGLKEGLTPKTKFQVLEKQIDEKGITKYVQVGLVKVDTKYPIWDNRFEAEEENANQTVDKTYFKAISGKEFFPGQLLRQVK